MCAVVCAEWGGQCRGVRGCVRWWACVGLRVGSRGGGHEQGLRGGCVVSVYVSARSGVLVWSVVGRAVLRKGLPSSAAAAMISRRACVFGALLGQWLEEGMLALG